MKSQYMGCQNWAMIKMNNVAVTEISTKIVFAVMHPFPFHRIIIGIVLAD